MDDQNYYDGSESVMKKFVDTRQARKKVADDVQLLENRIKLLKLEEKKVITAFPLALGLEKDRRH